MNQREFVKTIREAERAKCLRQLADALEVAAFQYTFNQLIRIVSKRTQLLIKATEQIEYPLW